MRVEKIRHELEKRLLNLGLRAVSIGTRFLFIILLAKFLEPAELGVYGLVVATISFGVIVLGFDFYTHSHREILSSPTKMWGDILLNHIIATGILYIFLFPLSYLLFYFELLPATLAWVILPLLLVEHWAQEIYRLLIVLHKPIVATVILFVRLALWCWVSLLLFWVSPSFQNVVTPLVLWLCMSLFSVIFGLLTIRKIIDFKPALRVDWRWILKGFKIGSLFFMGSISFKLLFTADKFLFEALANKDLLGSYVLFASLALLIASFMESAVFSFLYPKVVRAWKQSNLVLYRKLMLELSISVLIVSVVLGIAIYFITPYILMFIGKGVYLENIDLLGWLILAATLQVLSMIPHYGLYADNKDKSIVACHIASIVIFGLGVTFLKSNYSFYAIPVSLVLAFLSLLISKSIYYFLSLNENIKVRNA